MVAHCSCQRLAFVLQRFLSHPPHPQTLALDLARRWKLLHRRHNNELGIRPPEEMREHTSDDTNTQNTHGRRPAGGARCQANGLHLTLHLTNNISAPSISCMPTGQDKQLLVRTRNFPRPVGGAIAWLGYAGAGPWCFVCMCVLGFGFVCVGVGVGVAS